MNTSNHVSGLIRFLSERAIYELGRRISLLIFGIVLFCGTRAGGGVFTIGKPEWRIDFGGAIGSAIHFGSIEQTRGILVTLHSGEIVLVSPQGEKGLSMKLDLPAETPAVAVDLNGNGHLSVVAVDVIGSLYCFNEQGNRQWKLPRAVKSGEFRLPPSDARINIR